MDLREKALHSWTEDFDTIQDELYDDLDMSFERSAKKKDYLEDDDGSVRNFANRYFHRNFKWMGMKVNLRVFKPSHGVTKARWDRLDVVVTNLQRKTLYRYLLKTYQEDGSTPPLKELKIKDYNDFMRAIDMPRAILSIDSRGIVYLFGNFKDGKHSFSISFPRGTFIRKRPGQPKYKLRLEKEEPQYTFLEIYDGIDNFNLEGLRGIR